MDILYENTDLSSKDAMLNLIPYEMYESCIKIPSFGTHINDKNKPNNININNFNKFNNVKYDNLNKGKKNVQIKMNIHNSKTNPINNKIDYYPKSISLKGIEIILEQMKKEVCKINIGKIKGTGFFCKIPFIDNNNLLPVLITNNHIIDENILKKGKILLLINNEEKEIELENIIKYTNKEYDITIIEIKNKDKIENYLEIDNNKRNNKLYIGESIYILNYSNKKMKVSYGIIKEVNKYEFDNLCYVEKYSSGGPIFNIENN